MVRINNHAAGSHQQSFAYVDNLRGGGPQQRGRRDLPVQLRHGARQLPHHLPGDPQDLQDHRKQNLHLQWIIQLPHLQGRHPPLRLHGRRLLQEQGRLRLPPGNTQALPRKVLQRGDPQRPRLRHERQLQRHLQDPDHVFQQQPGPGQEGRADAGAQQPPGGHVREHREGLPERIEGGAHREENRQARQHRRRNQEERQQDEERSLLEAQQVPPRHGRHCHRRSGRRRPHNLICIQYHVYGICPHDLIICLWGRSVIIRLQHCMPSFPCRVDGDCPFLYQCGSDLLCKHLPVFPLTVYPVIIYSLFPICSAICNLSGNSFGEYKVLLIMDLLNYQANEATILAYPLITGTALFNFFTLIFKRHPTKITSLIDYNIAMVLIPNNLFGSMLGSLTNKFLPAVVSDSIILPIMIAFSIKFFLRYRGFKKQEKDELAKQQQKLQGIELNDPVSAPEDPPTELDKSERQSRLLSHSLSVRSSKIQTNAELLKWESYEQTMHLPHLFATIGIFIVFEVLSFLAQGKIVHFTICQIAYPIGVGSLTAVFIGFNFGMYYYTRSKMRWFREIGYHYEVDLLNIKKYLLVCLGGFIGGFNGGAFGIGASTTMIFSLLYLDIEPAVVSATVGYQILFTGLGSLFQAFATNQIDLPVTGLFLLETLIFGGVLTFLARKTLYKYSLVKVNQCLMLIVFSLVSCSSVALVGSIILGYEQFGAHAMNSVPTSCK